MLRKSKNLAVYDRPHFQPAASRAIDGISRAQRSRLLRISGSATALQDERYRILGKVIPHQLLAGAQVLDTAVPVTFEAQQTPGAGVPSPPVSERIFHGSLRPKTCSTPRRT